MAQALDVVTLGEAMLMLVADQAGPLEQVTSYHKRTAGAETNVAIGLARLGLRVGWGSRLGDDSMGRYLLAEMQREGIDCSRVPLVAGERSGFQFKGKIEGGGDPPVERSADLGHLGAQRVGHQMNRGLPRHLDEAGGLQHRFEIQ